MPEINLGSPLAVKVRKDITRALSDFSMIDSGDRIMLAVSGGKDSTILALMLREIRRMAPFPFSFEAVLLDQKQPGFRADEFAAFLKGQGIALTILEKNTYSIVMDKIPEGHTFCSLCSRLRRGILYNHAYENGFQKLALGHHRDDLIETLLMNVFYSGRLASMPPKLRSTDGRNVLIRPMAYVAEKDLIQLAAEWAFPVIPCNLCGSQDGLKRDRMRDLVDELEKETPEIRQTILHSLASVEESQLLDKHLWDFDRLETQNNPSQSALTTPSLVPLKPVH